MNEKQREDYCMNVAEIFSKKTETCVNLMIREQITNIEIIHIKDRGLRKL